TSSRTATTSSSESSSLISSRKSSASSVSSSISDSNSLLSDSNSSTSSFNSDILSSLTSNLRSYASCPGVGGIRSSNNASSPIIMGGCSNLSVSLPYSTADTTATVAIAVKLIVNTPLQSPKIISITNTIGRSMTANIGATI